VETVSVAAVAVFGESVEVGGLVVSRLISRDGSEPGFAQASVSTELQRGGRLATMGDRVQV
jgi:hypothetical protein